MAVSGVFRQGTAAIFFGIFVKIFLVLIIPCHGSCPGESEGEIAHYFSGSRCPKFALQFGSELKPLDSEYIKLYDTCFFFRLGERPFEKTAPSLYRPFHAATGLFVFMRGSPFDFLKGLAVRTTWYAANTNGVSKDFVPIEPCVHVQNEQRTLRWMPYNYGNRITTQEYVVQTTDELGKHFDPFHGGLYGVPQIGTGENGRVKPIAAVQQNLFLTPNDLGVLTDDKPIGENFNLAKTWDTAINLIEPPTRGVTLTIS